MLEGRSERLVDAEQPAGELRVLVLGELVVVVLERLLAVEEVLPGLLEAPEELALHDTRVLTSIQIALNPSRQVIFFPSSYVRP